MASRRAQQSSRAKLIKRSAPFVVFFLIGLAAGYGLLNMFNRKQDVPYVGNNSRMTSEQRVQQKTDQLNASYADVKDEVAQDVKAGKLTKEQSDQILQKLKELYEYRKKELSNTDTTDFRKKLAAKRAEMRAWALDNKLSSSYFTRLTI